MPIKKIKLKLDLIKKIGEGIPTSEIEKSIRGNLSVWDFNNDGDISDFDLTYFAIGVGLHEEFEERVFDANQINGFYGEDFVNKDGSTTNWNNFDSATKLEIINVLSGGNLLTFTSTSNVTGHLQPVIFYHNGKIYASEDGMRAISAKAPGRLRRNFGLINDLGLTDINGVSINFREGLNDGGRDNSEVLKIILERILIKVGLNPLIAIDVLSLGDPDVSYQRISDVPDTTLSSFIDLSPFRIHKNAQLTELSKNKSFGQLNLAPNDLELSLDGYSLYKENYLYKTTDSYESRVNKCKTFASGVFLNHEILGLPNYLDQLKEVDTYPSPQVHSTYLPQGLGVVSPDPADHSKIEVGHATGSNSLATKFIGHEDIQYFKHNVETFKISSVKNTVRGVIDFAIKKQNLGGKKLTSFTSVDTIDYRSKEIGDLISAIGDYQYRYILLKYDMSQAEYETASKNRTAPYLGGRGTRYYSDREIIQSSVWKIVDCNDPSLVYYTRPNEFYDYSLSGIFQLANFSSSTDNTIPLPINENLFLNKKVGDSIEGVYYLYNQNEGNLETSYMRDYFKGGTFSPVFKHSWDAIKSDVKSNFYEQMRIDGDPAIPESCYKIYLNQYPQKEENGKIVVDESRILPYLALPNYWSGAQCGVGICRPPIPSQSPPPTVTTTPTITPTATPSQTPNQTPSPTTTPSQTPNQSPSPSPTPTNTTTPTSTQTPTATITPTITPTATITATVTPTITVTSTVSATVTPTATLPICIGCDPSKTPTPTATNTPFLTPTPSISCSTTPSVTPTITVTSTVTPSPTPSVSPPIPPPPSPPPTPSPTTTTTPNKSPTPTPTTTTTPNKSPTPTPTVTSTPTSTNTPSITLTPTITPTTSATPTQTPTITPTPTVEGEGCVFIHVEDL
jgi:hypothetical protein